LKERKKNSFFPPKKKEKKSIKFIFIYKKNQANFVAENLPNLHQKLAQKNQIHD
jgi:hypothetical protein